MLSPEQTIDAALPQALKVNKCSAVYHALKRDVLLRVVVPGEALVEQHLAARFGCSQGTVREGLLRLQEDGLVSRRGYHGTVVSQTTPEEAAQMALIRIRLESVGVRRAAQAFGRDRIGPLLEIIDQMEEASRAGDQYLCSELDRHLHLTIFQASGLPALEPILKRCALHMHRYTYGNIDLPVHETPVGDQHAAVLQALAAGDGEAAAAAVRHHIEAVIDLWSPTLRRAMRDSPVDWIDGVLSAS